MTDLLSSPQAIALSWIYLESRPGESKQCRLMLPPTCGQSWIDYDSHGAALRGLARIESIIMSCDDGDVMSRIQQFYRSE